jgi:protease-4
MVSSGAKSLPDEMILVMSITGPIGETEEISAFADPFSSNPMIVRHVVEAIDKAAQDPRVSGLLVNLDYACMELAHIQEVREAVSRLRAADKFAHLFTASFADLDSGIGAYYFASAFDEIWMQPVGLLAISGLSIEMPFAREGLSKLGVTPEFLHREEYKSAMEAFTNERMSPENREMMQSLLDDISAQVSGDIVRNRGIKAASLNAAIDKGLLTGDEAVRLGLITKVGYADELLNMVQEKITGEKDSGDLPLVSLEDYHTAAVANAAKPEQAQIAIVEIAGEIVSGSEPEPGLATGDYIAGAIKDAADDPQIEVIILRVDSPGGSPSAAETIRRAVLYAKEQEKKIVVSMGPLAASGGYWVAVDADKIFALPTTLTGSIGVIMGKFELSGLWQKLGINWDGVQWGANADLWSPHAALDARGRETLNRAIDATYEDFIARVSEGRRMDKDKVRAVAKGRAWTGVAAHKNGLVDALGGLDKAIAHAAKLAEIPDGEAVELLLLPEALSPFEEILNLMSGQISLGPNFLESLHPSLRRWEMMERMGPVKAYDPALPMIRP